MKFSILLVIFQFFPLLIYSQNLLIDGGFEDNKNGIDCDYGIHKLSNTWRGFGTCQLFRENECFGSYSFLGTIISNALNDFGVEPVKPFDGDYLAAIRLFDNEITEWREFIFTDLQSPLKENGLYKISFYVQLSATEDYISRNFGVGFSLEPLSDKLISDPFDEANNPKPYNFYAMPNVMYNGATFNHLNGWKKVEFYYEATGFEKNLIIGNFKSDMNTEKIKIQNCNACRPGALIFIDNVSLEECDIENFKFTFDSSVICSSETLNIDLTDYPFHFNWFDNDTSKMKQINSSGTYSVEYTDNRCSVRDSFVLYKMDTLPSIRDILLCDNNDFPIKMNIDYPYHLNNKMTINNEMCDEKNILIYEAGEYVLSIENENCIESESFIVAIENKNIQISPNPTQGVINVKKNVETTIRYEIYDGLGKWIKTGYVKDTINMSDLSNGVYFIIFPENCIDNYKVLKNKNE